MTPRADGERLAPSKLRFVLVEPRHPGNVGAAARALKNLGFGRLVLVRPRFPIDDPQAQRMAVDARDVLARGTLTQDLASALAGAGTVVGTSARHGKHRHPHWRIDELMPRLLAQPPSSELALVFGREDRGLTDEELDQCTHLAYLPSVEAYPSFNLAQAVLLVAYELRRAELGPTAEPSEQAPAAQASHEQREAMYGQLRESLLAIGFLHGDSEIAIMRRIRRLLGRADLSEHEVRLLRGLARQIAWAAGQAGLHSPRAVPSDAAAPGGVGPTQTEGPDDLAD